MSVLHVVQHNIHFTLVSIRHAKSVNLIPCVRRGSTMATKSIALAIMIADPLRVGASHIPPDAPRLQASGEISASTGLNDSHVGETFPQKCVDVNLESTTQANLPT